MSGIETCYVCGGVEHGGPATPDHHPSCPYRWHGRHEPTVVLRLNPYQASNLLWLLKCLWAGQSVPHNSGDWHGEIPLQLEAKMEAAGVEFMEAVTNDGVEVNHMEAALAARGEDR